MRKDIGKDADLFKNNTLSPLKLEQAASLTFPAVSSFHCQGDIVSFWGRNDANMERKKSQL